MTTTTCPRCGHPISAQATPGILGAAYSETDGTTVVCTGCGMDEAVGNGVVPAENWPVADINPAFYPMPG